MPRSNAQAHARSRIKAPLIAIDAPSANSTVSTQRGCVMPGIANSGFDAGFGGPLRMPMRNAGTSRNVATRISTSPRTQMLREILTALQPFAALDSAKRLTPAPMRKKNPGAQKCVTNRVKNGSALG